MSSFKSLRSHSHLLVSFFVDRCRLKLRQFVNGDCRLIQATTAQSFNTQGCFAVDYDFATHRCYFFGVNVLLDINNNPVFLHCIIANGVPQPSSLGLKPNPTVVHITLCE